MILISPKLNTQSDELKELFFCSKRKIRGRLGLVLVIKREYQMTYYANVNNEKNCIRLRMFAIVV